MQHGKGFKPIPNKGIFRSAGPRGWWFEIELEKESAKERERCWKAKWGIEKSGAKFVWVKGCLFLKGKGLDRENIQLTQRRCCGVENSKGSRKSEWNWEKDGERKIISKNSF